MNPTAFVQFNEVCKYYQMGDSRIAAADHVSFTIEQGEFCVILGPSGAGKTTVLNMLGGMDVCDEGEIWLDGQLVSGYSQKELTTYRRYDVGFVFQFYNLVQNLTARENVELASEICREPLDADTVLEEVGLSDRRNNFPAQLSGGEQQRVSIARAIAKNPKILLCDEPTGALDYQTSKEILRLIEEMQSDRFGRGAQISLCVNDLILCLNRTIYTRNVPRKKNEELDLYQQITEYIEEHLDENLSLDSLAEEFYVSKYHIAHVFKDRLGMSIHQYITKKRLALCKEAFLGKASITEIYQTYGFGDYSSFYRAFKKEYGISPKDYREKQLTKYD